VVSLESTTKISPCVPIKFILYQPWPYQLWISSRTGIVVSPEGTDLVLTAHVPYVELHVLICNTLDVESDGRNCGDILVGEFQFVEDCCTSVG
jgi:hypothetical protein